jgi:hypothetical protein
MAGSLDKLRAVVMLRIILENPRRTAVRAVRGKSPYYPGIYSLAL